VTEVVMVAGGANTAYALQRGGAVWAWGDDSVDELGDTGAPSRARAVRIRLPGGIVSIAAGMLSAYALRRDGTVWAWGENSAGQRGRSVPQVASGTPRPISGLSDVVAIAAGAGDGYALRRDGTVWAWGDDSRGQLGVSACKDVRPSAPARSDCPAVGVPVRVQGLDTVKAIAAGANTAYALRRDRTVAAWGDNSFGTLGPSAHVSFSARAVTVARLRGVTAIGAGSDTAYAIMRDGRVRAWGKGVDGELGNGGFANRATPVQVREITGAVEVIGGGAMAYARDRNGRLWAWGSGTYGQLGNGRRISVPSPTRVLMSDLAALL
jgi:alpha-tubulin suppressor-like RCC1 family protein